MAGMFFFHFKMWRDFIFLCYWGISRLGFQAIAELRSQINSHAITINEMQLVSFSHRRFHSSLDHHWPSVECGRTPSSTNLITRSNTHANRIHISQEWISRQIRIDETISGELRRAQIFALDDSTTHIYRSFIVLLNGSWWFAWFLCLCLCLWDRRSSIISFMHSSDMLRYLPA